MLYYTQLQYLYLNSQNHVNFRCVNMPQIKGSSQRMKHNKNKKMAGDIFALTVHLSRIIITINMLIANKCNIQIFFKVLRDTHISVIIQINNLNYHLCESNM